MRPMRVEEKLPDGRIKVTIQDPRTEPGELLCPQRFSEEQVAKLEIALGQFAAAQMQQDPVPQSGGIFKRWMIQYWSPDGKIPGTVALPILTAQLQSWDCTFKGLADSDFVVGQLWGRGYIGNQISFFLLDQVRGRWTFSRTCDEITLFSAKHPKAIKKLVEDKANGPAILDTLQAKLPGIGPVDPEGGKEARANAVQPLFGSEVRRGDETKKILGCVYLPHPSIAPWVPEFVEELCRFPKASNDDQVDACTQALTKLYTGVPKLVEAMQQLRAGRTS